MYASIFRGFHPFDAFLIKLNFEVKMNFVCASFRDVGLRLDRWSISRRGPRMERGEQRVKVVTVGSSKGLKVEKVLVL